MEIRLQAPGIEDLERLLSHKSAVDFDAVVAKQAKDMLTRAREEGGTPVDTGELRKSSKASPRSGEMGYTVEYAPHVEYGHRTRNGGFVQGQRFLQANVETQRPIYKEDLIDAIRKV